MRKYIAHVDADYKRNKVTVCANLSNIYNTFVVRHGRPGPNVNNFFDIEKWMAKFGVIEEVKPELRRNNTISNINDDKSPLLKQENLAKDGSLS